MRIFGLDIKSHTPGRIRLQDCRAQVHLPCLAEELLQHKLIISHKVNHLSHSILIHYDAKHYSSKKWLQVAKKALNKTSLSGNAKVVSRVAIFSKTPLKICSDIPGRIRLRHPTIGYYENLSKHIEQALINLHGVLDYKINRLGSSVLIYYNPCIISKADLMTELGEVLQHTLFYESLKDDRSIKQVSLSSITLLLAIIARAFPALAPISGITTLAASLPIFRSAMKSVLQDQKIKVDALDSIAIVASLGFKRVIASALMVWVVEISKYLLINSASESQKLLSKVFGKQANKAVKIVGGHEELTRISELKCGDHIAVYVERQIPVDGEIIDGTAMIDEHLLTGESQPAEKAIGEKVYAMTTVLSGKVIIKVDRIGENTSVAKITKIIKESMKNPMQLQSQGEKFANSMVLPTLMLAMIGYITAGSSSAMAIINADFGTGIRMAAPVALMVFLSMASKHGIIIKNSLVLETIKDIDTIIFDKTGTLTHNVLYVANVVTFSKRFSQNKILAYTAAAEAHFTHPVALAITKEAQKKRLTLPVIDDTKAHIGCGIEVNTNLGQLKVGSEKFIKNSLHKLPKNASSTLNKIYEAGNSAVLIAVGNQLIGLIELVGEVRAEAAQVIHDLKRDGKKLFLISGDHRNPTRVIAKRLGFDHSFSNVSPKDKAKYVKRLQEEGYKVAMVGDGVNDAIALSQADCSISLRGASEVATDIADIVFIDGDLKRFNLLFEISRELDKNVRRSFSLILLPNFICVVGALLGVSGLSASLILNNGFNLAAVFNSLLPYYKMLKSLEDIQGEN